MLMEELKNTLLLTKVRIRINERKFKLLFSILFISYLTSLIPALIQIFYYNKEPLLIELSSRPLLAFILGIIMVLVAVQDYEHTGRQLESFPRVKRSLYLSSQLINYCTIAFLLMTSLVFYLFQEALMFILSVFKPELVLLYCFHPGYILVGLVVNLLYAALIVELISLFGSIYRKSVVLGIATPLIIFGGIFYLNRSYPMILLKAVRFLVHEKSITLFLVKASFLWVFLFLCGVWINSGGELESKRKKINGTRMAGSIALISFLFFAFFISMISVRQGEGSVTYTETESETEEENDMVSTAKRNGTIEIDVSSLENGSDLRLNTSGLLTNEEVSMLESVKWYDSTVTWNEQSGNENKIIVNYILPANVENNVDVVKYCDMKVTAKVQGNQLLVALNYAKDKKLISSSPWVFMGQFDWCSDISKGSSITKSNTSWNGQVSIFLPTEKNFNIIQE